MNINSNFYCPSPKLAFKAQSIQSAFPKVSPLSFDNIHFGNSTTTKDPDYEQLFIYMEGFGKNREWAQKMWDCVESATGQLNSGQLDNLKEILDYFSENYQRYSGGKGHWRHPYEPRIYSAIAGPLAPRLNVTRRQHYAKRAENLVKTKGSYYQQKYLRDNPKIYFFEEDGIRLAGIVLRANNNLGWYYVSTDKSKQLIPKINAMYQDALSLKGHVKQDNLTEAINKVATIHWWMIQALQFTGGAAGISDMLTKTLFKHLGIQTSKWRPNIAPDMEALTTPLNEYIQNYPSFFQKPLVLVENN